MRRQAAFVVAFVVLASACSRNQPQVPGHVRFRLAGGGAVDTGSLLIADTPAERSQGLMNVRVLSRDEGMVFLFDQATTTSFWMKDTTIPLSIAFWQRDGRIVDILDMRPCTADPCPTYASAAPYTTALEMRLGWFARRGIRIGDRAVFSYASL